MTANEAADLLGVKTATVYTYVTRGSLTAHRRPGDRTSWFSRQEIESLHRRTARRSGATVSRETATAITLIADGAYWYRGYPALELAHAASFEQVAELLWTGALPRDAEWSTSGGPDARALGVADAVTSCTRPLDALRVATGALASTDEVRFGVGEAAQVVGARTILTRLVQALMQLSDPASRSFAALVWSRLCDRIPSPEELAALNGVMVLMADHGISPSTFAARTAASYRADLYGVVQAGLAIMAGGWYGGRALSAERMLDDIGRGNSVASVVGERTLQGTVPALGQPRYPDGDPRFAVLIGLIEAASGTDLDVLHAVKELVDVTRARALPPPSVEFGLAALCKAFGFVDGSSEAIFAISRIAGWTAHAMEEYESGQPSSPEFRYIGISPLERPRVIED